jgi:hypothetical protein
MPARLAAALAAIALALAALPTRAQTPRELAERLYERAAVAAQLAPIPGQFAQGLELQRGMVPDEVIAALVEAGKKSFAEDVLHGEIVSDIAKKMKPDDIAKTLDWLDGRVGRRVTLAEASASASIGTEEMRAWLESDKAKPRPEREGMIAELMRSTRAVETGAGFIEAMSLGIAVGMDVTQPVEKRIGVAGLRSRLRAAMPPQRVRRDVAAMLPPTYRYVYREVSDADIADYVKFSASPLGQRYNEAVSAALVRALARASVRVGEKVPAAAEKQQI